MSVAIDKIIQEKSKEDLIEIVAEYTQTHFINYALVNTTEEDRQRAQAAKDFPVFARSDVIGLLGTDYKQDYVSEAGIATCNTSSKLHAHCKR